MKRTQAADRKKFKRRLTPALQRRMEDDARRLAALLDCFPQAAALGGMHWAIVRGSIVARLKSLGAAGRELSERVYPK